MPTDPTSPEAIAEALREATPGPWVIAHCITHNAVEVRHPLGGSRVQTVSAGVRDEPTAHLIANAPTWLAQLLAALEARDGELAQWKHAAEMDAASARRLADEVRAKDGEVERLREALEECVATAADCRANLTPAGYKDPLPYTSYRRVWDASYNAEQKALAALTPSTPGDEQ